MLSPSRTYRETVKATSEEYLKENSYIVLNEADVKSSMADSEYRKKTTQYRKKQLSVLGNLKALFTDHLILAISLSAAFAHQSVQYYFNNNLFQATQLLQQ
jgi:hypothetical protein